MWFSDISVCFRANFTYTSREWDRETGLYYYRARYYDPMEGRFISKDPIGFDGGINVYNYVDSVGKPETNLYAYVQNNPINKIDPLGLQVLGLPEPVPTHFTLPQRMPDFVSASVSFTIPTPWTGTFFSWSFSGSADRYGNWYWSPIGPGAGRAPTIISGSLTANWLGQKCKPTSSQLSNFLSGNGVTGALGYWGGGNVIYSPGNGIAGGFGFVSPQAGGNYSYSFQGSGNTGISW